MDKFSMDSIVLILLLLGGFGIPVLLYEFFNHLKENSPEEINIIKDRKDFLIEKKKSNEIKYLAVYKINQYYFGEEKGLAIKCSTLGEIENHYIGYLNDLETHRPETIKKLK